MTCTRQQRKTMRRPLRYMAAAVLMALPSAGLSTMSRTRKSALRAFGENSSRQFSEKEAVLQHSPPATPLNMVSDTDAQRHEFELNLGKAVDTLKHDYQYILTSPPDYSIYDHHLEVVDPAKVKLHGLPAYRNAFRLVHTVVNLFYCPELSSLTFRVVYDWARNEIRVSWNAHVVPKAIFGGTKTTLHVDGISCYVVDKSTGKIVQHRVEHLMINDSPVKPKRGILHALEKEVIDPDCIPAFIDGGSVLQFTPLNPFQDKPTSLFSMSSSMNDNDKNMDWEAFERKNESRKKFGLDPLTKEEFQEIQAQVEQMKVDQASAAATTSTPGVEKKEKGLLGRIFGDVLEDTCESNFDCQRPQVCCDFGFTKKCCTSGMLVGDKQKEKATVPVPVESGYPPDMGPDSDPTRY